MRVYEVRFFVEVPEDVDQADIQEFIEFELGERAVLKAGNALSSRDIESLNVTDVTVY